MRILKPNVKHIAIVLLFLTFVILFAWIWRTQLARTVTCTAEAPSEPVQTFGLNYVEMVLNEQHPIEPTFHGQVFIGILKADRIPQAVTPLEIQRSSARTYLSSTIRTELLPASKGLYMKRPEEIDLVTKSGKHIYFPFDSSTFDFRLTFDHALPLNAVRITNRVPGFILKCDSVRFSRQEGAKVMAIQFALTRAPLVQLSAVSLGLASLFFLIFILLTETREALPISVASFFFSLWSIRAILQSEIRIFPTVFDCWILTLSVVMLLGLCFRVVTKIRHH